jgi:hypothetical protein
VLRKLPFAVVFSVAFQFAAQFGYLVLKSAVFFNQL